MNKEEERLINLDNYQRNKVNNQALVVMKLKIS
jgi:hypothetical protein